MKEKVVLAYSGGLDTSVILKWLIEEKNLDVICYLADLGQEEEITGVEEKAKKCGASEVFISDLKEEFVKDFVFPMFRGNAIYEGEYLLGTSIARPLIAQEQIAIARKTGATHVAHGATGKGNDQVRFELTCYALYPGIKIIAPWREWDLNSRESLLNYAEKHNIPVTASKAKPYSCDRNLLHISFEGGILEDPWSEPDEEMFVLSVSPEKAPDEAEYVEIDFEKGDPVSINGNKLSPATLLKELNRLGGKHGVGRVDLVENRFVGMKSRGVYETPGGTILYKARRTLESLVLDREVMAFRDSLVPKYAQLVYNGFWFAPERLTMQAAIDQSQQEVTGTVRIKLYKGNVITAGRKSPFSKYSEAHATFEADEVYNQKDAEGFIKLNALRLMLQNR
ncbi:MAG: argininosuccinate synthase [Nitrospinae bacterium]|nr:argininosuccinate synthase [Nitrospinota bacterium]